MTLAGFTNNKSPAYYSIPKIPDEGVTLELKTFTKNTIVTVYISYTFPNPSEALYDLKFTTEYVSGTRLLQAGDGKIFIPPQQNSSSLYFGVVGNSVQQTNFSLQLNEGNQVPEPTIADPKSNVTVVPPGPKPNPKFNFTQSVGLKPVDHGDDEKVRKLLIILTCCFVGIVAAITIYYVMRRVWKGSSSRPEERKEVEDVVVEKAIEADDISLELDTSRTPVTSKV